MCASTRAYFGRNVREPVRFAAAIGAMAEDGSTFSSKSDRNRCWRPSIAECLSARGARAGRSGISCAAAGRSENTLLQACAGAYAAGCDFAWERVQPSRQATLSNCRAIHGSASAIGSERPARMLLLPRSVIRMLGHRDSQSLGSRRTSLRRTPRKRRLGSSTTASLAGCCCPRRRCWRLLRWPPDALRPAAEATDRLCHASSARLPETGEGQRVGRSS